MSARNEESATVILAPFLPTQMSWRRERFRKPLIRTIRVVDLRPPRLLLIHDARILELLDERLLAPDGSDEVSIRKTLTGEILTDMSRSTSAEFSRWNTCSCKGSVYVMLEFPFLTYVPLDTDLRFRELQEVLHAYEVDERIAHITPYRLVSML